MIDVLALPNVSSSNALLLARPPAEFRYSLDGHKGYKEVMEYLISKYPQWDFVFVQGNRNGEKDADGRIPLFLDKVRVQAGKEVLGFIGVAYHGTTRKVYVLNHRTSAQRSRNQGKMFTADTKRAIQTVTKMFSRKSPTELMNEALEGVAATLRSISVAAAHCDSTHRDNVKVRAAQLVMDNRQQLLSIAEQGGMLGWAELAECLTAYDKHTEDVEQIQTVNKSYVNKTAATVVALQNSYVVHWNDTVSIFTNDTLPHELRSPLGLLKLTEPKTLLRIGLRVNDDVYLVVPEGESDAV